MLADTDMEESTWRTVHMSSMFKKTGYSEAVGKSCGFVTALLHKSAIGQGIPNPK